MGIQLGGGNVHRDWKKISIAGADVAIKAITIPTSGFANVASALLKVFEVARGDDNLELKATTLVFETLIYAVTQTMADASLRRVPQRPEAEVLTRISKGPIFGKREWSVQIYAEQTWPIAICRVLA